MTADQTFKRFVPLVLRQHVEDAAILHASRTALTRAAHVKLLHLRRFDRRLEAHLDGVAVAGHDAWPVLEESLELPSSGRLFTIAIRAIEEHDTQQLERLLALSQAMPEARAGLPSAFGWVEAAQLRGIVADMLRSQNPLARWVGVTASALHRVDPGLVSGGCLEDTDALVRARGWRAAGELGKRELLARTTSALDDDDEMCRFWAAWSALLLGGGESALRVLTNTAIAPGPLRARAFHLALQAMNMPVSQAWLRSLAPDPGNLRWLVRGAGLVGDPVYVPWLIGHMNNNSLARLAGEAFSMITGIDLAWLDLDRRPPEDAEPGPNDDPNDSNIEMDEDDGLPWPDQNLVQTWWDANSHRFKPGVRYFMGEPLNQANCVRVLKDGFQRQRIAAAFYLSLLNPGTPLFEWRAPARRQERLLSQMS